VGESERPRLRFAVDTPWGRVRFADGIQTRLYSRLPSLDASRPTRSQRERGLTQLRAATVR